jgi:hypothetical protein
VIINSIAYVVADDEQHLGVFSLTSNAPGELMRMFVGDLPDEQDKRKKAKADLEALLLLPPFGGYKHGALFAVGSGSKRSRMRGVLLRLNADGVIAGDPHPIDLSGLFAPIEKRVGELNIEGAVIANGNLNFLQRGNRGAGVNAIASVALSPILQSLEAGAFNEQPFTVRSYNLGSIGGIPFGFTDGAALPDGRIVFTAVAEDTQSAYEDGHCAGAAVGILAADGQVQCLARLSPSAKVEGVHARVSGRNIRLHMVSDADDVGIAASLLIAEI